MVRRTAATETASLPIRRPREGRGAGLPTALPPGLPAGQPQSPACGGSPAAVLPLSALLAAAGRLLPLPARPGDATSPPSQLDEGQAREQLLVNLSATAVLQAVAAEGCRFGRDGLVGRGWVDVGAWGSPNLSHTPVANTHPPLCASTKGSRARGEPMPMDVDADVWTPHPCTHASSLLCLTNGAQAQRMPSQVTVTAATFGSQRQGWTTSQYHWRMFVSGRESEEGRSTRGGDRSTCERDSWPQIRVKAGGCWE